MAFKFTSIKKNWSKIKEQIVKEEEQQSSGGRPDWLFEPKKVDNEKESVFKIRFLPLPGEISKPYVEIKYHMFMREGDNRYIKVIDPRQFDKTAENPITDLVQKLYKSDNALDKDQAGKMRSKSRYFTLVYVKDAPENQKDYIGKVLVYEAGFQIYQKLDNAQKKLDLAFWDPFEGTDFLLTITETGNANRKYPSYNESEFSRKDGPIVDDEDEMEKIAKEIDKIGDVKKKIIEKDGIKTGKELNALLEGGIKDVSDVEPKKESKPAKDLVSDKTVSDDEPDFGEYDESEKEESDDEVEKVETEASVDDLDLDFDVDDFNIDD